MGNAIYMAASGAMNHQLTIEVITKNLQNLNTSGYKVDRTFFQLLEVPMQAQPSNGSPENAYHYYSLIPSGIVTDFSQGMLKHSDNPLHIAIEGNGFFEIETPAGPLYTRKGDFTLDEEGRLITQQGYPVQGEGGEITIEGSTIDIAHDGSLSVNGELIDQIKIAIFDDPTKLERVGQTYFKAPNGVESKTEEGTASIVQGALEESNANPMALMNEMILAHRGYESYQKVIRSTEELSSKAINNIGKLG